MNQETKDKISQTLRGRIPWNKGKNISTNHRDNISKARIGIKFTESHRNNMSKSQKGAKFTESHMNSIREAHGKKNELYNTSQYRKVHRWIVKEKGKPSVCDFCLSTAKHWYEWSNKSQKYLFDLDDWQRLCRSCHQKYDYEYKRSIR